MSNHIMKYLNQFKGCLSKGVLGTVLLTTSLQTLSAGSYFPSPHMRKVDCQEDLCYRPKSSYSALTLALIGGTTGITAGLLTGLIASHAAKDPGVKGKMGATGLLGPQGETGERGDDGPQGPTGDTGTLGQQGPTGLTGASGATGAMGPVGSMGSQGPTGLTGATGTTGSTGNIGSLGSQGPTGITGATGATGAQGCSGICDCTTAYYPLIYPYARVSNGVSTSQEDKDLVQLRLTVPKSILFIDSARDQEAELEVELAVTTADNHHYIASTNYSSEVGSGSELILSGASDVILSLPKSVDNECKVFVKLSNGTPLSAQYRATNGVFKLEIESPSKETLISSGDVNGFFNIEARLLTTMIGAEVQTHVKVQ